MLAWVYTTHVALVLGRVPTYFLLSATMAYTKLTPNQKKSMPSQAMCRHWRNHRRFGVALEGAPLCGSALP